MSPKQRFDKHGNWLPPGVEHHRAKYRLRRMVAGQVSRTPLGATYREAIKAWADLTGEAEPGTLIRHAIVRYLDENPGDLKPRTLKDYKLYGKALLPVFGHVVLGDLKPSGVAMYLDARSSKTAGNREIAFLTSVYEAARRWGWCDINPCKGIRRNKERPQRRTPTEGEVAALKAAADKQMACIIDLATLTGLRKGDLLALTLRDWTPDGLKVQTSKTGAALLIRSTPALESVMDRVKHLPRKVSSFYLFHNRQGRPYTESGFNSNWRRVKARAGVDVPFHGLRRYAAQRAKERHGQEAAQALLAHASGQTTAKYLEAAVREVWPVE